MPESIQSDSGPHFVNEVVKALNDILSIKHKRSTSYYPQSNGRAERAVGTIKNMIKNSMMELSDKPNWSPTVYAALWSYRSSVHRILAVSRAEVVFGHRIRIPSDKEQGDQSIIPNTEEEHWELVARRLRALPNMVPGFREAREDNKDVKTHTSFSVGDLVWVRNSKNDMMAPVFSP